MADINTKFIFVKNGAVSAILFPGEPVNSAYGQAAGEVPIDAEVGVGDTWPKVEATSTKKSAKKADGETPAA